MTFCLVCGKPIFQAESDPTNRRTLCISKPGALPGTTCRGIYIAAKKGNKIRPYGLTKVLRNTPGGVMLLDEDEAAPLIRESY